MQLLIDHGANSNIKNTAGYTALHIMAAKTNSNNLESTTTLPSLPIEDDFSHSSVDTSPSLLFDHDNTSNAKHDDDLAVESSFYQSPREMSFHRIGAAAVELDDTLPNNNSSLRGSFYNNDSGYFTAKGGSGAWTKSKYYKNSNNTIDEEDILRSDSNTTLTLSESSSGSESEEENDDIIPYITWLSGCLDAWLSVLLHILMHMLHALLLWSNRTKSMNSKPGDTDYVFVTPPKHVAEAMDMYRRSSHRK